MNPQDYIPTPCHEDWNLMTGDQRQKFCNKCSTHVHDLTDYSSDEILALKVQNGGKLCGTFRLARPLTLGASIATLALASCQQKETTETENTEPVADKTSETIPVHADPIPNLLTGIICVKPELEVIEPEPTTTHLLGEIEIPEVELVPLPRIKGKIHTPHTEE